jgi:hypothetical protein
MRGKNVETVTRGAFLDNMSEKHFRFQGEKLTCNLILFIFQC